MKTREQASETIEKEFWSCWMK